MWNGGWLIRKALVPVPVTGGTGSVTVPATNASSGFQYAYLNGKCIQVGLIPPASVLTSSYTIIGKTMLFEMNLTITTNGTCATLINFSLPFACNGRSSIAGLEYVNTGKGISGLIVPGATKISSTFSADGTYWGASSNAAVINGTCEIK